MSGSVCYRSRVGRLGPIALAILVAMVPACRRRPSVPPELTQTADALTAAALAEAVALAGAGGEVVLADIERTPDMVDPFSVRAIASIRTGLSSHGLSLRAEERLPINPELERTGEAIRKSDFLDLLRRHASANLLLLLVPPPSLTTADLEALPSPRPKILLVTNWQAPQLAKYPKSLIQVAIVPRREGGSGVDFATQFQIIK